MLAQPVSVGTAVTVETPGRHDGPSLVRVAEDGSSIILWRETSRKYSEHIRLQFFDPKGEPVGGSRFLGDSKQSFSSGFDAIPAPDGNGWIVLWRFSTSRFADESMVTARALRISADSRQIETLDVFQVNGGGWDDLAAPAICGHDGGFVVAWSSPEALLVRRFAIDATPLGDAETVIDLGRTRPALACLPNGGYRVGWKDFGDTYVDEDDRVWLQRFEPSGAKQGEPIQLNDRPFQHIDEIRLRLTQLPEGPFVAQWNRWSLRFFDAQGVPRGPSQPFEDSGNFRNGLRVLAGEGNFWVTQPGSFDVFESEYSFPITWQAYSSSGEPLGVARTLTHLYRWFPYNLASNGRGRLVILAMPGYYTLLTESFTQPGDTQFHVGSRQSVALEGKGATTFEVHRTGGSAGQASVLFEAIGATAEPGSDFIADRGVVFFEDGESTPQTIQLTVLDDGMAEAVESFSVRLQDIGNGRVGEPKEVSLEIRDDDSPSPLIPVVEPVAVDTFEFSWDGLAVAPRVAVSTSGTSAVVWEGTTYGPFGRRFEGSGEPLEPVVDFEVFKTHDYPQNPDVLARSDGGFVVVWKDDWEDNVLGVPGTHNILEATNTGPWGGIQSLHETVYDTPAFSPGFAEQADGLLFVGDFDHYRDLFSLRVRDSGISTPVPLGIPAFGRQAVASQPDGTALVLSQMPDSSTLGLVGLALDIDGRPLGEPFVIHSQEQGIQGYPSLVTLPDVGPSDRGYFATWHSRPLADDETRIMGRFFDHQGQPVGDDLRLDPGLPGSQENPRVAAYGSHLVVTWESHPPGASSGIVAQVFDRQGRAVGPPLELPSTVDGADSLAPDLAIGPQGGVSLVWFERDSINDDSHRFHVMLRRFSLDGL